MGKDQRMGHHNEEFKHEAVRLFMERAERTVNEVAAQLGVSQSMLYRWKAQCHGRAEQGRVVVADTHVEAELRRLRKENAELREDCELLKKAAAFFASVKR